MAVRAPAPVLCHPGSPGCDLLSPLVFLELQAMLPTKAWVVALCFNPLCTSAVMLVLLLRTGLFSSPLSLMSFLTFWLHSAHSSLTE